MIQMRTKYIAEIKKKWIYYSEQYMTENELVTNTIEQN